LQERRESQYFGVLKDAHKMTSKCPIATP
jgi:hypothetical protein